MFVQVIQAKLGDVAFWERQVAVWRDELRAATEGFLGFTAGVTSTGDMVTLARFASADLASAASASPAQAAWFDATTKAFDGPATFHDCTEVDVVLGGGSDRAGFVQVIQGRVRDEPAARRQLDELSSGLRELRPDLLGSIVAWHGDGGVTQAAYFTSEAEAHANERAMAGSAVAEAYRSLFDGEPTFLDLSSPEFA